MSTLFICGTSFGERTILYNINYIMKYKVEKVIFLKENHQDNEDFSFCGKLEIMILDNLHECIAQCDMILVMLEKNVFSNIIQKIQNEALKKSKICYVINDEWFIDSQLINNDLYLMPSNEVPIILHIAQGKAAQSYCLEVTLNKMFRERDIKFTQIFTDKTQKLLEQLSNYQILNEEIELYFENRKETDIIIYSINIDKEIGELSKYVQLFSKLKIDYVILQVDFDYFDKDNIVNSIKHYCFSGLDKVIRSQYAVFDDKYIIYCKDGLEVDDSKIIRLESYGMEENIYNSIVSKLSLPDGILRIM